MFIHSFGGKGSSVADNIKCRAYEIARGVAGCPHASKCRSEFHKRYGADQPGQRRHFASVPSPDFIGSRYQGLVIIGGNPGLAHANIHHQNDARMFELQRRLARGEKGAFDELMRFLPESMANWPQVVNADGRRRLRFDIENVAYIDIVKCGTAPGRADTSALFGGTEILNRCWTNHTRRLLELLAPTHILTLWTPIKKVLEGLSYSLKDKELGNYNGARHLTLEQRYAPAVAVVEDFYKKLQS